MFRFVALFLAISLAAQAQAGKWSLGVYSGAPELTGYYRDSGNLKTSFDIQNDFNLEKDKIGLGIHLDYSGARFGFSLDYGYNDYAGQGIINRVIQIGGYTFPTGINVTSALKNTAFDVNWTIKALRMNQAWLGVDVGIQGWYLDVQASGALTDTPYADTLVEANEMYVVPIPQLGVSGGFQGLQDRITLLGKVHFLAYKGAKYTRLVADARYYFLPWLGVRAFVESQSLDAPDSSIIEDIEVELDRNGFGFGVVARW